MNIEQNLGEKQNELNVQEFMDKLKELKAKINGGELKVVNRGDGTFSLQYKDNSGFLPTSKEEVYAVDAILRPYEEAYDKKENEALKLKRKIHDEARKATFGGRDNQLPN